MSKDYYEILGIGRSATQEDIKRAYRQKAKHFHPDLNSSANAQARFQELTEAHSILSNEDTRRRYDNGDLNEPEITFTWAEVQEMLRRQEEERATSWVQDLGYSGRNRYSPTDYKANARTAAIINRIMMLFAFSFILDFFIFTDAGSAQVINLFELVNVECQSPGDSPDAPTKRITIKVSDPALAPALGQTVDLRKSLFYGVHSFKTPQSSTYIKSINPPPAIYLFALLVFIAGALGSSRWFTPEAKFNAAIVSTFFGLIVLTLLLLS